MMTDDDNPDSVVNLNTPNWPDLWRRASAGWLAGLVVRGIVDDEDAFEMVQDLACNLAKRAYNL
jgi:glucuronate isomerase